MTSTALTGIGDPDTLSLDELVESKIIDASVSVILAAPVDMLSDIAANISGSVTYSIHSPKIGILNLPPDFLRLVAFKMSSWPYTLYQALDYTSPEYIPAHSPYGVVGTKDRPLLFLMPGGTYAEPENDSGDEPLSGEVSLENVATGSVATSLLEICCPSGSNDSVKIAKYAKRPVITGSSSITLGSQLYRPTVYYAAYLVAQALQDVEGASRLLEICNSLLKR